MKSGDLVRMYLVWVSPVSFLKHPNTQFIFAVHYSSYVYATGAYFIEVD